MTTEVPSFGALPFPTVYAATAGGPQFDLVPFAARDGRPLSFQRLRRAPGAPDKGPVILVPGAGDRANLFCPPLPTTLPLLLSKAGYDVYLMNWRASIDLPPVEYTLDDAAMYDFPAAIDYILAEARADKVKAVIHCQGSCAFMMSIAAGKLRDENGVDKVSVVVANSSALHPWLPRGAGIKLPIALKFLPKSVKWFNPQWGISAPRLWPKLIDWAVRAFHHECHNGVCKHSSFVFGFGFPTLWRHENLDEATHDWLRGEFAQVPRTLFDQLRRSQGEGKRLRATRSWDDWPEEFGVGAPLTNARFAFITGEDNQTFRPEAIERTFDYFMKNSDRRDHTIRKFHAYGHLDIFLGQAAAVEVFPYIMQQLELETGPQTSA